MKKQKMLRSRRRKKRSLESFSTQEHAWMKESFSQPHVDRKSDSKLYWNDIPAKSKKRINKRRKRLNSFDRKDNTFIGFPDMTELTLKEYCIVEPLVQPPTAPTTSWFSWLYPF